MSVIGRGRWREGRVERYKETNGGGEQRRETEGDIVSGKWRGIQSEGEGGKEITILEESFRVRCIDRGIG